jgi:hypothetical protein
MPNTSIDYGFYRLTDGHCIMWSMAGAFEVFPIADAICPDCGRNSCWSGGFLREQRHLLCQCGREFDRGFVHFLLSMMYAG